MNTRKVINQIDLRLRLMEEMLSENPALTWDSCNLPSRLGGLWEDTTREDTLERSRTQSFRNLRDETYGMLSELLSYLYSEGVDIRNVVIEEMESKVFPNPTPREYVHFARAALGVLRAKTTALD